MSNIQEDKKRKIKEAQEKYGPILDSVRKNVEYLNSSYSKAVKDIFKNISPVLSDIRKMSSALQ